MNINIRATNFELTPEIQAYLDKKLESVDKLIDTNDSSAYAHVELGKISRHHKSGDIFRAEINLSLKGQQIRAEAEGEDLYKAIHEMKESLVREVDKMKERKLSLLRRGLQRAKRLIRGNRDIK